MNQFEKLDRNEILKFNFGYVSYNPSIQGGWADTLLVIMGQAKSRKGRDETAFKTYSDGEWRILNGDFREEYSKCSTRDECIAVYDKYKAEFGSDFSTSGVK